MDQHNIFVPHADKGRNEQWIYVQSVNLSLFAVSHFALLLFSISFALR